MKVAIDVNGEQVQAILDALMDNFGVLALPEEVAEDLAEWAIRYQATALAMGSTAELEALARRLTAREIEDGILDKYGKEVEW